LTMTANTFETQGVRVAVEGCVSLELLHDAQC
jgi:hypothetical protein